MTYNTIIFDLDGTLLNTLDDLKDSVNYALNQLGFPQKSIEEVRNSVGNGAKKLIQRVVPEGTSSEDIETCFEIYQSHYATNNQNKTKPYDGILALLKELKKCGCKLAVVSNKFDASVKALCKIYFEDIFDIAIGESQDVARKPAPDSVYATINTLESTKGETLYVGDSDVDVHTAQNAGVKCIAVTWGFRDRDILEAEGADYIIDKPDELLQLLN